MARTIDQIQNSIIVEKEATPELSALTSQSRRSEWRLWARIIATIQAYSEQLFDVFKAQIEALLAKGAPSTPLWIQDQVFKFQYDATNPQVLVMDNYAPAYTVVDETLRIVTRCSVKTDFSNTVNVKVAKSETPEPLGSSEKSALQDYVTMIGTAGITYLVISSDSDKLYVEADVYYRGQYSAIISDSVQTAITNFLSDIPFDGKLLVSDLEIAIKNVAGVKDVVLKNVYARKDTTLFASATKLIENNCVILRGWDTIAGYIVPETTSGQTLNDSLNFISQ
jgi:hypothetical protein